METFSRVEVIKKLEIHNQLQLLEYLDLIDDEEKKNKFLESLNKIDYPLLEKLYTNYFTQHSKETTCNQSNYPTSLAEKKISPIESNFSRKDFHTDKIHNLMNLGLHQVYEGKVALLILAGGQGSRLGFNKAKGMYNINMPSNKSLFEFLCTRFLSIQNLSKKLIINKEDHLHLKNHFTPSLLLIMTSLENHEETVNFFTENNFFGIKKENIIFFPQDTLPALDLHGKIISKSENEIFEAPNGNGGCFIAMKKHKIIEQCLERKIDFLHVISIDNPLSIPLDPFYIGVTLSEGKAGDLQMAAKVVPKRDPTEPVGVFLNFNGKPEMMDYGDMPKDLTTLRDEEGQLVYRGGNILNYLISVKLLNNVLLDEIKYDELISEFHISKKNIPCVKIKTDQNIKEVVHTASPGVKFELFFNSIFKFASENGLLLLEVEREEEFAPVKNSDDSQNDNPRTCKRMMTNLFSEWYKISGGKINFDDQNEKLQSEYLLEIDYLLSYNGENIIPGINVPEEIFITENNKEIYFK
jgi:UDP-N-acetylglucosamine/UDP-N-acetylgalactosamine diphosphorylase